MQWIGYAAFHLGDYAKALEVRADCCIVVSYTCADFVFFPLPTSCARGGRRTVSCWRCPTPTRRITCSPRAAYSTSACTRRLTPRRSVDQRRASRIASCFRFRTSSATRCAERPCYGCVSSAFQLIELSLFLSLALALSLACSLLVLSLLFALCPSFHHLLSTRALVESRLA